MRAPPLPAALLLLTLAALPAAAQPTPPAGPSPAQLDVLPHATGSVVWAVAFSPDGRALASGGQNREIRLWDPTKRERAGDLTSDGVVSLCFAPGGAVLASAAGGAGKENVIRLWDLAAGAALRRCAGHTGSVYCVAFSPDGRLLASASADHSVRLWDAATGKEVRRLAGHAPQAALRVAFSPTGRAIASCGDDATVRLWDVATGQALHALAGHTGQVIAVAFAPDGRTLASGGLDGMVCLWDVRSGRRVWQVHGGGGSRASWLAFRPDGRTLAVASGASDVILLETATGQERARLAGHARNVYGVAFAPDGRTLASAGEDGTVRLWDVTRPGREAPLPDARALEAAWEAVAGDNPTAAYYALNALAARPARAVPLVRERLKSAPPPAAPPEHEAVLRLVARLDDDEFDAREQADDALRRLGRAAERELRQALEGRPSPEVQRRVERLLGRLGVRAPEDLRAIRGVEVLEGADTAAARRVLEELAGGPDDAVLAQEARAALGRLRRGRELLSPPRPEG